MTLNDVGYMNEMKFSLKGGQRGAAGALIAVNAQCWNFVYAFRSEPNLVLDLKTM